MARQVRELLEPGAVPLYRHPEWKTRFPWLVQGTTGRGEGPPEFDLGVFSSASIGDVLGRWTELRTATATRTVVHSRQVHGTEIGVWQDELAPGLFLTDGLDAHLSDQPGVLLAVSVADCVPVFIVEEESRTVALVHAGWRGAAGGIVERAIAGLEERDLAPSDLWIHFGPSICGECYEVGPEVHAGVNPGRPLPDGPTPIDLREALARRAVEAGASPERITISAHCTLCGPGGFFSHRGGSPARQMGVLGRLE